MQLLYCYNLNYFCSFCAFKPDTFQTQLVIICSELVCLGKYNDPEVQGLVADTEYICFQY